MYTLRWEAKEREAESVVKCFSLQGSRGDCRCSCRHGVERIPGGGKLRERGQTQGSERARTRRRLELEVHGCTRTGQNGQRTGRQAVASGIKLAAESYRFLCSGLFFFSPLATLQLSSGILTSWFVPGIPRPTGDISRCHAIERSKEKRQMEVAHVGARMVGFCDVFMDCCYHFLQSGPLESFTRRHFERPSACLEHILLVAGLSCFGRFASRSFHVDLDHGRVGTSSHLCSELFDLCWKASLAVWNRELRELCCCTEGCGLWSTLYVHLRCLARLTSVHHPPYA